MVIDQGLVFLLTASNAFSTFHILVYVYEFKMQAETVTRVVEALLIYSKTDDTAAAFQYFSALIH